MNLAFKELKYYKFKYLLITFILFLLAFLVIFVSSLAQGLGKDNISMIESLDGDKIIIQKGVDNQLNQSHLSAEDQQLLEDKDISQLAMNFITLKNNDKVALTYSTAITPDVIEGHLPRTKNEIVLDEKLSANISAGDFIHLKNNDVKYKVTGFVKHQMFAHTSLGLVTKSGYEQIDPKVMMNIGIMKNNVLKKADLNDAEIITKEQLMKGIPSYEAEQLPLNLMVVFLFVISAIVITAFFYIITLQKTKEYGILKAIGTKNTHIIKAIFSEVLLIVIFSALSAIALIYVIMLMLPATMPFYMNSDLVLLLIGLFVGVSLIGALLSVIKVINIDPLSAIGGE